MFTVRVVAVPGITELGLTEQVGARAGVGATAQVSVTAPLKAFTAATVTVAVDDIPALIELGESAVAESEKSCGKLNVEVAIVAEFMVTLHVPIPEQAPLHPAKVEPAAAVAVSVTAVLVAMDAEHKPGQLMSGGLAVTVPLPVPARIAVSG